MFDIGFSEILLIAVVALLVVGPRELPGLVRNVGRWVGNARRVMNALKSDFEREIHKADDIQRRMAKEIEVLNTHQILDRQRKASPVVDSAPGPSENTPVPTAPAAKEDHGPRPS